MADIRFSCGHCGQTIACDAACAGMPVQCPACASALIIPSASTPEISATPAATDGASGVFISYRRDGGEHLARLVKKALDLRGYPVFMDVENLKSGKFNTALLTSIETAADVVVICSRGVLDRCVNPDDWVRQEIRHALRCRKNVVLLKERGFEMPPAGALPPDIAALASCPELSPASEMWEASMDRLTGQFLRTQPGLPHKAGTAPFTTGGALTSLRIRTLVAGGIACLGLLAVLLFIPFSLSKPAARNFPRLVKMVRITVATAGLLNLLIAIGAKLTARLNPLGPRLVLGASLLMIAANPVCCYFLLKAFNFYPQFRQGIGLIQYLLWSINVVPYLLTAYLYRKAK